jgi:hypothetical protein
MYVRIEMNNHDIRWKQRGVLVATGFGFGFCKSLKFVAHSLGALALPHADFINDARMETVAAHEN